MKSMFGIVFCVSLVAGVAVAMPAVDGAVVRSAKKSLLKPMAFAKTMNDMPMEDRWAIEAEGYLPYESVYDASGRCIKNCAYPGITLREEIERTQRATNQLVYDLCMDNGGTQEECATAGPGGSSSGGGGSGGGSSGGGSGGGSSGGGGSGGSDIASLLDSPILERDVSTLQVSSIPGPRMGTKKQSKFHPGVDMDVDEGTPVRAIYDGVVTFAGGGTTAGCFVMIEHTIHGHKYYSRYLHLKGDQEEGQTATDCKIDVDESESVAKGEQIALSGNTGKGTGAHLHYEMFVYDVNGKPMYIDMLGSVQNWEEVNQDRRASGYTKWSYEVGGERRNLLGRTYIVDDGSSNVMIKNCKANPDSNMPTSGTVGSRCGTGNSNAEKVCQCITKSLMGCTGVY